ncbi:hypothetical protein CAP36_08845 [Chitinophagaceae bacterium IBVUCB2]|nr:hypothetical protein CAP36_08845 [Chitinophagaceae bacterium IBVUCB2]
MKSWTVIILISVFCLSQIVITAQSVKLTKTERKQEQKNIDSLLLVRSMPVRITAKDSLFRMDLQILLRDSLKAKKFEVLNYEEASDLSKKFFENLFGVNNKQRMLDNIENVKKNKDYFIKEMELAHPYLQIIEIAVCNSPTNDCIAVKRVNSPNGKKYKNWNFFIGESESLNQFVSRIMESLTLQSVIK